MNNVTRRSEEQKNALQAMQWIIFLAQLEYSGNVKMGKYQLDHMEAADLMSGDRAAEDIIADLDLLETDPKAYGLKTWKELTTFSDELVEKSKGPKDGDIAIRQLPSMLFNTSVRDHIKHEINKQGEQASFDWYNEWQADHRDTEVDYTPEQRALKNTARRVVWVVEARKRHQNGEFYIKTKDSSVLPAWEIHEMTLNGQFIRNQTTDNKNRSVDQKFYDADGKDIYSLEKHYKRDLGFGRYEFDTFARGTPVFDDVTDEALVSAVNDYMAAMGKKSPILATAFTADVSPMLKGLKAPITSFNGFEMMKENMGSWGEALFGDNALNDDADPQEKEAWKQMIDRQKEKAGLHDTELNEFITASQDKIKTANELNSAVSVVIDAPKLSQ